MAFSVFVLNTLLDAALAGLTFLFFAYFKRIAPITESTDSADLPFISVIVPARNEGSKIRRCLESLANQDYPHYEIIAIDDRSTDDTGTIIRELAGRYD